MRLFFLLLASVLTISSGSIFAAGEDETSIQQTFTVDGDRYEFTGSFIIAGATRDCLLDMLFDPDQLRVYARHIDSLELLGAGEQWQIIAYHFSGLFYHGRSIFKRRINRPGGRIDYTLQSIEQGGLFSADIGHITGHYSINKAGNGRYSVTFHQQGTIGGSALRGFYFSSARSQATDFLSNMQRYASSHCR